MEDILWSTFDAQGQCKQHSVGHAVGKFALLPFSVVWRTLWACMTTNTEADA